MALTRTITPDDRGTQIIVGDAIITIMRVGESKVEMSFHAPAYVAIKVLPAPKQRAADPS